jgi:hypothetical protein
MSQLALTCDGHQIIPSVDQHSIKTANGRTKMLCSFASGARKAGPRLGVPIGAYLDQSLATTLLSKKSMQSTCTVLHHLDPRRLSEPWS